MPIQPLPSLKGFGVTLRQIFRKPITQEYPEFKRPVYPRFRGRHRLNLHDNGLEKCVGCSLCAAACPADCIRVVAAENTPDNRVSAGERYARIYEINMSRCIFCGYCELACPFDAITLGNDYELSEYHRDDQIYTKEMLLAPPIKQTPVAEGEHLRHPRAGLGRPNSWMERDFLVWIVWLVATTALFASGLAVVLFQNPFYSALSLIVNLASLAVLFLAADGGVRRGGAGARLRRRRRRDVPLRHRLPRRARGRAVGERPDAPAPGRDRRRGRDRSRGRRRDRPRRGRPAERGAGGPESFGSPASIGTLFLSDHLLAFEVTSIILLVAAVGGVILGSTVPPHHRAEGHEEH